MEYVINFIDDGNNLMLKSITKRKFIIRYLIIKNLFELKVATTMFNHSL